MRNDETKEISKYNTYKTIEIKLKSEDISKGGKKFYKTKS